MWATPRATSTAFEWAMKNRGDFTCFHEPYNEAFYYGIGRRHNRYFDDDPALKPTPGLTFESVHQMLLAQMQTGAVFIKEFAYSVSHLADDAFLDHFRHTFLIRDPEKVITSMHARWPDITLGELGFEDLHTLFKRVSDRDGAPPPVIDSDELVAAPKTVMAAYCEAVHIPFMPETLEWQDRREQNANATVTWNDDRHGFHDTLKASTGIAAQKRNYPPLESDPRMLDMYAASLPHYQALYKHRIGSPGTQDIT